MHKKLIIFGLISMMSLLFSCQNRVIHQGKVFEENAMKEIKKGDSKYRVETLLGTPTMADPLHPNRVYYIEQFKDPKEDIEYIKRVEIEYDQALRVHSIHQVGMPNDDDNNE